MRDAIGGVVTIEIIIVFLLLVNGYLAFSVNYTKAFRVKNQIISLIEQHEGLTTQAKLKIDEYLTQVHYKVPTQYYTNAERAGYTCERGKGYCVKVTGTDENAGSSPSGTYRGSYYSVMTFINIDIPILNKILPLLPIMQVKGESKLIYSSGTNSEFSH